MVPRHVAAKPQAAGLVQVPLVQGSAEWVVSVVTPAWDRPASTAPHLLELLADAPACGVGAASA